MIVDIKSVFLANPFIYNLHINIDDDSNLTLNDLTKLVFQQVKICIPNVMKIKAIIIKSDRQWKHYQLTEENFKDSIKYLSRGIYVYYKIKNNYITDQIIHLI